jgi:di/tricarboxylate transporter
LQPTLTPDGALTLAVTALAVLLFVWNRYRADVVALITMLVLIVTGVVTPQQGISGFAHEATVTVALMLVLAAGLLRTGAIAMLARHMARLAAGGETRLLIVVLAVTVPLSALINNTAAVAVLLPVLLGLARDTSTSPSRLLMPLSFASQLGGTLTLIGTSTNLLVAGIALDLGIERIRLFDITPPAAIIAAAGVLYLLTIGRWLLPDRPADTDLLHGYELHDYLTVVRVPAQSPLVGRSLAETRLGSEHGLQAISIERNGERIRPTGATVLQPDDRVLVEGKIRELAGIEQAALSLELVDSELAHVLEAEAHVEAAHFAEVLVPRRSAGVGATLRQIALRARFGVSAVALRRHGAALHGPIAEVRLEAGDMLLVRGTSEELNRLHEQSGLVLLGAVEVPTVRRHRLRVAVAIMGGVVLLPAIGAATILVSALLGVVAMVLTGCLTPDDAYREMDWMVLVLLGAILPLGAAMHATGAAAWIAHGMLRFVEPIGPHGLLAALLVLTTLLTSVISNAAAGIVLTPIAIALAVPMGYSPLPFVIAVMIGASNSFISPVGYQTNTMIYGPGGYEFLDYLRVGGPLALVVTAAAIFAVPLFFPF